MQLEGFFPLKGECESSFLKRVDLYKNPASLLEKLGLPPRDESLVASFDYEKLISRFGVKPTWISLISSSKGLMPWEAASTWNIEVPDVGNFPILQFRKGKSYFGYGFQEIFEHEALHAVRAPLQSKRFEEIICYRASSSKFRQIFGGIFLNPHETILYLIVWLISILGSLFFSFFEMDFFLFLGFFSFALGICLTCFGFFRLFRSHQIIKKALNEIKKIAPHLPPEAVLLRLSDEEIVDLKNKRGLREELLRF